MVDNQLLERAIDEAPIGVTIADAHQQDDPLIYLNDAFERLTGYPKGETLGRNCRFLQGEGTDPEPVATMREAIDDGEPASVELRNYRKDGTEFWNKVDIAPLREDGEITHYVGFQTDVTTRKEAEFEVRRRVEEVEREREKLERLLERIDGLLEDITRTLVQATSREEIERTVCDRLIDEEAYGAAWIGEQAPTTNDIVPNVWTENLSLDGASLSIEPASDPTARALASATARFVTDGDAIGGWHRRVLDHDIGSLAAIPLVAGDTDYGVLTLYATGSGPFDEHERVVLESIGRATASACRALESRRILTADTAVELEFSLGERDLFFVRLSARSDSRFSYEGAAQDGDSLVFFTVRDANPDRIRDLATESAEVDEASVLTATETSGLLEFRLGRTSLVTRLANRGVRIRSMNAEDGKGRLRVVVPGNVNPRSVAELVAETCPDAELVSAREHERPPQTDEEYRLTIEEALTDRQLLALRKAYVSGYFDPNRQISGDEIAASMGISRSTFHQHLRAGERKLLREFFERGIPD